MNITKYRLQISLLEFWVDYWSVIKDQLSLIDAISELACDETAEYLMEYSTVYSGLCQNSGLEELPITLVEDMFKSWGHFSGDTLYPLGRFEYGEMTCITDNPLRLDLAKHCLEYLTSLGGNTNE